MNIKEPFRKLPDFGIDKAALAKSCNLSALAIE
jgi:hypothetical protein